MPKFLPSGSQREYYRLLLEELGNLLPTYYFSWSSTTKRRGSLVHVNSSQSAMDCDRRGELVTDCKQSP
jgi:hypothetical protein